MIFAFRQVAEQRAPSKKDDKSPRPWTLKPLTWTEVRPFDWPKLTESERVAMARQARLAFKALKIPESDPAWENVIYRNSAPAIGVPSSIPPPTASSSSRSSGTTSSVPASAQPGLRRPVTSKETKHKTKPDVSRAKGEIPMKDESAKVSVSRRAAGKKEEPEQLAALDSAVTKSVPSRRLPGSGYQVKKDPQVSAVDGVTPKSTTLADARPARHSLPASLPPKPSSSLPFSSQTKQTSTAVLSKLAKRADESDRERDGEMERDHEREKRDREKRKDQRPKEREKQKPVTERATPTTGSKRKTANLEPTNVQDEVPSSRIDKKRKIEEDIPPTVSSSSRDLQLPKKPVQDANPPPRQKIKKESSPSLRGSVSVQDTLSSPPPQPSKADKLKINGTLLKTRRKSPIYTSSEDEGEIHEPELQTRQRKPSPIPPVIESKSNGKDFRHRPRASYPLPSDHAALRARYQSCYTNYLGAFSKIVVQKQLIEAILKGEPESEVDLMDPDELTKLSLDHKTLKEELVAIHEMYMKGKHSSSPE